MRFLNMPKADDNSTPTPPDAPEEWPIGALEPVILNLGVTVGIFHHMINSPSPVEASEWGKIEDDLIATTAQIKALWRRAWDRGLAERREHEAALEAARAERAAAGSPKDVEQVEALWSLLSIALGVAARQCADRGFPLAGFRREAEELS
jgi:hypothetical protein